MKRILTNYKFLLLALALIITITAIKPNLYAQGAYVVGAKNPAPPDIKGFTIIELNGMKISNVDDYHNAANLVMPGQDVRIKARYETKPFIYMITDVYPFLAGEIDNKSFIGIQVSEPPRSSLNFGLELNGGTKLVLQPELELSQVDFENVIDILRHRLDLFGVKGAAVSSITDLSGKKYIQVELAGVGSEEAQSLLEKEGKFEARIRNQTIFTGLDLRDVCISGVQCTMTLQPLQASQTEVIWDFTFAITLTQEAANRFAEVTNDIEVITDGTESFLNATVDFYIDNEVIEGASLRIPADLKGRSITDPVITGRRETKEDAQGEMRYLQSILQSRKLPVKLEILNIKSVSPTLGKKFISNIFFLFIAAILLVDIVIALRYRDFRLVAVTVLISFSEILITLGIAAAIHWTLDIASIAGIIASVGTGIDDQIVILDEVKSEKKTKLKQRISKAFFIVIAAFTVSVASMIPLLFAGAGLLRGFAVTTIIGLFVGVLITRPAFAELVKLIEKD